MEGGEAEQAQIVDEPAADPPPANPQPVTSEAITPAVEETTAEPVPVEAPPTAEATQPDSTEEAGDRSAGDLLVASSADTQTTTEKETPRTEGDAPAPEAESSTDMPSATVEEKQDVEEVREIPTPAEKPVEVTVAVGGEAMAVPKKSSMKKKSSQRLRLQRSASAADADLAAEASEGGEAAPGRRRTRFSEQMEIFGGRTPDTTPAPSRPTSAKGTFQLFPSERERRAATGVPPDLLENPEPSESSHDRSLSEGRLPGLGQRRPVLQRSKSQPGESIDHGGRVDPRRRSLKRPRTLQQIFPLQAKTKGGPDWSAYEGKEDLISMSGLGKNTRGFYPTWSAG